MIYTCTMNPSLDYYMEYHGNLKSGSRVNRSELEYYEAGGKGINVSIVLNNLGIPTRAFGFIGGFTRDFYIQLLAKYEEIIPNFTYINGHTRINIKFHGKKHTNINATGPYVTPEDMQNLREKVRRLGEGDYFVLAGVTQEYLEDEVKEMLKEAIEEKVRICLDTNPKLMKEMLPYKPFLIKTTKEELEQMIGKKLKTEDELIAAIKQVHADGAMNVMVLTDNRVAYLSCDKGTYECEIVHATEAVNTVGTGDSLTAGFLMNYLRSRDAVDSFKFGASCGSATAYSKGLATREKIDSFYDETKITKID